MRSMLAVSHCWNDRVYRSVAYLISLALFAPALQAYSVLTHEAIIDTAWDADLQPLLLRRYPQSTPGDLRHAHACAYAGSIVQDLGYYPFGNRFFSDLLHYVRTGDFVLNLIAEAHSLNEYAFALGALAHYAADTQGHGVAVNRSVALQYPALARKFGPSVTYADDRGAHIKVEFGFDVSQVARGNYAPEAYHDFIGFQVERGVLERAFRDTYSMELADLFDDLDLALATYRHAVSVVIPAVTRAAWHLKRDELAKAQPAVTKRQFVYNLSRASYRKEWSGKYRRPGTGTRVLAFLLHILPRIGPLQVLQFRPPTSRTTALFEASFDRALHQYRQFLASESTHTLALENRDFDTAGPTRACEYRLADRAYARLARQLASAPGAPNAALVENVLDFHGDPPSPCPAPNSPEDWQQTLAALRKLRAPLPPR